MLRNVEVCLQSVPELWYDTLSKSVHGEVCIKGFIFVEVNLYLLATINANDLTGWIMSSISCKFKLCGLHAYLKEIYPGYIGEWQPDDAVKLIDRQKNIFKLSEREYVAVESLENIYSSCSFVESVCDHFPMYQPWRKYELHDMSPNILLTKMTCRYRILSNRIEIQHNEGHKNGWYQIIPNIKNGCRRFKQVDGVVSCITASSSPTKKFQDMILKCIFKCIYFQLGSTWSVCTFSLLNIHLCPKLRDGCRCGSMRIVLNVH